MVVLDPKDPNAIKVQDVSGKVQYLDSSEYKPAVGDTPTAIAFEVMIDTLVFTVAEDLLKATNKLTTLELKLELRKLHPQFYWTQQVVSTKMDKLANLGVFTYKDNGTYRIYSSPAVRKVRMPKKAVCPKPTATMTGKTMVTPGKTMVVKATQGFISREKALSLMENNKGHFFTAVFSKADGTLRTMNCQYLKGQVPSKLGYLKVNEVSRLKAKESDTIRQINMQTLKELSIAGGTYKIK